MCSALHTLRRASCRKRRDPTGARVAPVPSITRRIALSSCFALLAALPNASAHAQLDTWPQVRVSAGAQWSEAAPDFEAAFSAEAGPRLMFGLDGHQDGTVLHVAPGVGCLVVAGQGETAMATAGVSVLVGHTTWGLGGRLQAMVGEMAGELGGGADLTARALGYGFSLEVGGGVLTAGDGAVATFRFSVGLDLPHLIGSFLRDFRSSWANFEGLVGR